MNTAGSGGAGQISKELDLLPDVAFRAGSVRVLPNGNTLPGLATESRWSYVYYLSKTSRLSKSIEEIVAFLELHAVFVRKLCLEGGTLELYIQLPGDLNIGDAISWGLLKKMAQLRISLGLEVFPKRGDGQRERGA